MKTTAKFHTITHSVTFTVHKNNTDKQSNKILILAKLQTVTDKL